MPSQTTDNNTDADRDWDGEAPDLLFSLLVALFSGVSSGRQPS